MKSFALLLVGVAACGQAENVDDFGDGLLLSNQAGVTVVGDLGSQVGEDLAIGDIDGDGVDDLLLVDREYQRATDEHQRGAVHIVYGGEVGALMGGPSWDAEITASANTLEMPDLGYGMDLIITFAGDLDGDGVGDFAIGRQRGTECIFEDLPISDDDRHGEVYVVYGGPRLSGTRVITDVDRAARLLDSTPCGYAGAHVAGDADLDGDGRSELAIVASPRANGNTVPGADRLYIVYGKAQRLSGTLDLRQTADLEVAPSTGMAVMGWLEAVGDVDGDGFEEFAVGEYQVEPYDDWMTVVRGYHLPRSGLADLADIGTRVTGDVMGYGFDRVGDLDGDGFDELAVTSRNDPTLYALVYGRADLLAADFDVAAEAAARFIGSTGWSSKSIAGGDIDGDGHGDLVIGDIDLFEGRGGAYVVTGSANRFSGDILVDDLAAVYAGGIQHGAAVDSAGMSIGLGDLDGDGRDDVAVGAPNNHVGDDEISGRVYLLSGGLLP